MKRTKVIQVFVSDEEKRLIGEKAKKVGLSESSYARTKLLETK